MPSGNRKGPSGEGPKTGREMGFCMGNDLPGYMTSLSNCGKGYGRRLRGGPGYGWGGGFEFRHGFGYYYH